MNARQILLLVVILGPLSSGLARAQAAPEPDPPSTLWLGAQLGGAFGLLTNTIGSRGPASQPFELNAMYSIAGSIEWRIVPYLGIGFAPAQIFQSLEHTTMIDLPVRLIAGHEIAPTTRLYGFATAGREFSVAPQPTSYTYSGVIAGLGGGASIRLSRRIAATAELTYQLHLLHEIHESDERIESDIQVHSLALSVGLATALF